MTAVSSCSWIDRNGPWSPAGAEAQARLPASGAAAPDDIVAEVEDEAARPSPPPVPRVKPVPPAHAAALPPEPQPAVPAAKLVGLSESELEKLLGQPASEKLALPARIREYRDDGCGVRLYLYADLKSEKYKVLHMQPIPAGMDAAQADSCVTRIARRATVRGER